MVSINWIFQARKERSSWDASKTVEFQGWKWRRRQSVIIYFLSNINTSYEYFIALKGTECNRYLIGCYILKETEKNILNCYLLSKRWQKERSTAHIMSLVNERISVEVLQSLCESSVDWTESTFNKIIPSDTLTRHLINCVDISRPF